MSIIMHTSMNTVAAAAITDMSIPMAATADTITAICKRVNAKMP